MDTVAVTQYITDGNPEIQLGRVFKTFDIALDYAKAVINDDVEEFVSSSDIDRSDLTVDTFINPRTKTGSVIVYYKGVALSECLVTELLVEDTH